MEVGVHAGSGESVGHVADPPPIPPTRPSPARGRTLWVYSCHCKRPLITHARSPPAKPSPAAVPLECWDAEDEQECQHWLGSQQVVIGPQDIFVPPSDAV